MLETLNYNFLDDAFNFLGVHHERIGQARRNYVYVLIGILNHHKCFFNVDYGPILLQFLLPYKNQKYFSGSYSSPLFQDENGNISYLSALGQP